MSAVSAENVLCSGCGNAYPHTKAFFYPNKSCVGGLPRTCKKCAGETNKMWEQSNRTQRNETRRQRYKLHPGTWKRWRENNPAACRLAAVLREAKRRAKERGEEFDERITLDMLRDQLFLSPSCPCCAVPFSTKRVGAVGAKNPATPSLDRFDSSRGYTLDNVSLICWRCNNVKGAATASELEAVARWMKKVSDDNQS